MQGDVFERDGEKAALNWRHRAISFKIARFAFQDVFGIAWLDDRHDDREMRFSMLGMVQSRLLHVTFTLIPTGVELDR
jgi:uncharacterized DUF497 family protein